MNKKNYGACAAILKTAVCLLFLVACGEETQVETAAPTAKGQQLYLRNGCAVCHGDEGRGDGRLAATLKPPPRDFRNVATYKKGAASADIARTIGKGLAGTSMPAFAHIAEDDRLEIARYIVYLQKKP